MRRRVLCQTVALMVFAGAALLAGDSPPPAPADFAWKKIESVNASFLVPKGWHFQEESSQEGVHAFFISEEEIRKGGEFETGLTVNVFLHEKDDPQERARSHIAALAQDPSNSLQKAWEMEEGVLKGYGGRYRRIEKGYPPLIMHVLAIGNATTHTLYIIMFESPEANWDKAWAKGEEMMKIFLLDDEI